MRYGKVLLLGVVAVAFLAGQGDARVRLPIAAGTWYPADAGALRAMVEKHISEAEAPPRKGRCVACIVPHGGYGASGDIAGHAFRLIEAGQYDRVIVLGPSHFAEFRGCSIPSVEACRTPLGDVAVDGPAVRMLDRSSLIDLRALHYKPRLVRVQLHEREHAIEVVLPFLQVRLGAFKLVPIIVGDLKDYSGGIDVNAVNAIARLIRKIVDERTLVVVSSDFTHHGNKYSFRPFKENILEGIEALDRRAFDLILSKDFEGFRTYLEQTRNPICGKTAICILLKLLSPAAQGVLLSYDVSGRRNGDLRNSVSYAAIAFFEGSGSETTANPSSPAQKKAE